MQKLVDGGVCIPQLGQKADSICNTVNIVRREPYACDHTSSLRPKALEKFTNQAPAVGNDEAKEALFDKKVCLFRSRRDR
jgi:ribosomal protein L40E